GALRSRCSADRKLRRSAMAKGRKTGGGSRKGSPNKATADVRAAIAGLAERNASNLEKWLKRVARKEPGRAADIFLRAIEYHIPKLARTELTSKDGKDLTVVVQAQPH